MELSTEGIVAILSTVGVIVTSFFSFVGPFIGARQAHKYAIEDREHDFYVRRRAETIENALYRAGLVMQIVDVSAYDEAVAAFGNASFYVDSNTLALMRSFLDVASPYRNSSSADRLRDLSSLYNQIVDSLHNTPPRISSAAGGKSKRRPRRIEHTQTP